MNLKIVYLTLRVALITGLLWATQLTPVMAGGVVGTGTPASCTEAALDAALAGGGTVTFNCGAAPHTIVLTDYKSIAENTEIQGGGRIILSGNNTTSLFQVFSGKALSLKDVTLREGQGTFGAIQNFGTLNLTNGRSSPTRPQSLAGPSRTLASSISATALLPVTRPANEAAVSTMTAAQ